MPRSKDAAAKVRRDQAIHADRCRGLTWPTIARRHNVSERQARKVWTAFNVDAESLLEIEPLEALKEALSQLDAVIEDLALLAETTTNDAVELGAVRARHTAMMNKLDLMRSCGVLPNFDVWRYEVDARRFVAMVLEVFDRHEVPPEVEDDLLAALATTTGRANGSNQSSEGGT